MLCIHKSDLDINNIILYFFKKCLHRANVKAISLKYHVDDSKGVQQDIVFVKSFLIHYHDSIVMGTSY